LRNDLNVGTPVVFALTAPRALTRCRVSLCNTRDDGDGGDRYYAKVMEVQTGPNTYGPWTSVDKFTSQKTWQEQTFATAPGCNFEIRFGSLLQKRLCWCADILN
jgi:hypothetical protein